MSKIYEIIPPAIPSAGVYLFNTPYGDEYEVRFGRKENDILSVSIVFGVINEEYDGEEYSLTNRGDVFNVMNTVSEVVRMYKKEHPNVHTYEFSGEPSPGETQEEPTKRIRLYHRYVKRIFTERFWNIELKCNTILVRNRS